MFEGARTMKGVRVVLLAWVVAAVLISPWQAAAGLNYRGLVEEIGKFLNKALVQYRQGNIPEAQQNAQDAYFQVFENLEGPIRINISARKNYELEEELVAIRNMIVAKEPAGAIEARMNDFMAKLTALVPALEGGAELVAEAADATAPPEGTEASAAKNIEPVWLQAFESIQAGLGNALDAYRQGNPTRGAELVLQTQYDHYKNSLFETAVRRHISQKKDFENNDGFTGIAGMIQNGEAPEAVEARISMLIAGLRGDLPGLPLVDGAVSKKQATKAADSATPEKDWSQVTAALFGELDQALALYGKGETKRAVSLVQNAYFDVFEASGMEAKLGARDADAKDGIEGHFGLIAGRMKSGASVDEIRKSIEVMRGDVERAAATLAQSKDSPAALFFYSLMIILREGIEAILIITAIIAYLLKTGHRDKLRVIYSGCGSAIVLSVVTAVLVKWVFKTSAANQETMEGATMLLASAVLFFVSYWLISKAEAQKWTAFIKDKIADSLSANSLRALWFAAFLAVYREGAETVLFYQALAADASGSGLTAVAGGFVLGGLLLVAVYLGMRYGAVRLPLRPFFLGTGALLYYMAFVFAGKGVMELAEGKLFEPTLISWIPSVPLIGFYPYLQTLVPQLLLVLAAMGALALMAKRRSASVNE